MKWVRKINIQISLTNKRMNWTMALRCLWVEILFQNLLGKGSLRNFLGCGLLQSLPTPVHFLLLIVPDWLESASISFHVSGKIDIHSSFDKQQWDEFLNIHISTFENYLIVSDWAVSSFVKNLGGLSYWYSNWPKLTQCGRLNSWNLWISYHIKQKGLCRCD